MIEQAPGTQSEHASTLATDLRDLIRKLLRRLREHGHLGDLSGSQAAVLSRLQRDGDATVTTLAQAEGMRPQSMGAVIAALQAAGHVTGTPDPSDGRQTILGLTPACRDWITAGRAARQDWLVRAIETSLSPAEQQQLATAIRLLGRLAGP